jgi:lipopolysaccharide biosynthesis regulator YciM
MATSDHENAYPTGVDRLLAGSPEEAIRLLAPALASDTRFELRLALGKAQAARGDATAAAETFAAMLSGERAVGKSLRAYVLLLSARTAATRGLPLEVERLSLEAERLDARLAPAARRLRASVEGSRV